VSKESKESKGFKDSLEREGKLELLVQKVHGVLRARMEHQEKMEQKEPMEEMDQTAKMVHKDLRVRKETQVLKAQKENKVLQGHQAPQVLRVHQAPQPLHHELRYCSNFVEVRPILRSAYLFLWVPQTHSHTRRAHLVP